MTKQTPNSDLSPEQFRRIVEGNGGNNPHGPVSEKAFTAFVGLWCVAIAVFFLFFH
jgi:hypothetical protein